MTQMQATWRDIDVSAYVDGELDPAAQAAFEMALDQDHALRQKVKEMREVVALVRAVPLREPPRNYLLTPSMVAEKPPQRARRRPMPLLFMRLATSLAAVAFVITAGLTVLNRGLTPMMTQAPRAAEDMLMVEAPQAVVVEVEVAKEAEAMTFDGLAESVEEDVRTEKLVEIEEPVAAMAPPALEAAPEEEEVLALEAVPAAAAEAQPEPAVEDDIATVAEVEAAERIRPAAEPIVEEQPQVALDRALQTSNWQLPAILGAMTLLLAAITYWISRRR